VKEQKPGKGADRAYLWIQVGHYYTYCYIRKYLSTLLTRHLKLVRTYLSHDLQHRKQLREDSKHQQSMDPLLAPYIEGIGSSAGIGHRFHPSYVCFIWPQLQLILIKSRDTKSSWRGKRAVDSTSRRSTLHATQKHTHRSAVDLAFLVVVETKHRLKILHILISI